MVIQTQQRLKTMDIAPDITVTFDFGDGPVAAHRHINPDGYEGGWIADTARVFGNATPE